ARPELEEIVVAGHILPGRARLVGRQGARPRRQRGPGRGLVGPRGVYTAGGRQERGRGRRSDEFAAPLVDGPRRDLRGEDGMRAGFPDQHRRPPWAALPSPGGTGGGKDEGR